MIKIWFFTQKLIYHDCFQLIFNQSLLSSHFLVLFQNIVFLILNYLVLIGFDVSLGRFHRWVTQKLLSCNDIPRFMIIISSLGSTEVMALHIDTFVRKESLYPACVITSWIVSRSWWEHGIIVFGIRMLLVCIYSVNDCFIENHKSLSRFLGIEVHSGATLLVQSIFQDIFERRANNVLNA